MNPSGEFYHYPARSRNPFWRLKYASLPAKLLLGVLVLATASVGWSFLIYYQLALQSATLAPTSLQNVPLMDHGRYVYFTRQQGDTIRQLEFWSFVLTPVTLLTLFWLTGALHDIVLLLRKV